MRLKPLAVDLVLPAQDLCGEGPVWDGSTQALWWTDIPGKRLHRLSPGGTDQVYPMPGQVGCFAFCRDAGLVLAMEQGFATWRPEDGALIAGAQPALSGPSHRFNDGRCDRQGRFLAGTMNTATADRTGQLWRLAGDGTATRLLGDVAIANGLAFSPCGRTMYWACSLAERVLAFDYDPDTGTPHNGRPFLPSGAAPGVPDGAAVDAEGCYWSARWMGGCVARFTPAGAQDQVIRLPVSRVTMCAFGGADLRTLVITTAREDMTHEDMLREPLAGALFAAQPGATGLPEPRFNG